MQIYIHAIWSKEGLDICCLISDHIKSGIMCPQGIENIKQDFQINTSCVFRLPVFLSRNVKPNTQGFCVSISTILNRRDLKWAEPVKPRPSTDQRGAELNGRDPIGARSVSPQRRSDKLSVRERTNTWVCFR